MALLVSSGPDPSDMQPVLFDLITECNRLNTDTLKDIEKITAVKRSTREELYRRLYLAREWVDDSLAGQITPGQITPGQITPGQITPGQITLDQMAAPTGSGQSPLNAAPYPRILRRQKSPIPLPDSMPLEMK